MKTAEPASKLISKRIAELGDWRGETLRRVRELVHQALPDVVEEWKWMGTPVWSHEGILCTGESYKQVVKLTFLKGASLRDPKRLFNSSLDGNARRAIDLREGDGLDGAAFKALIREAAALNAAPRRKRVTKPGVAKPKSAPNPKTDSKPKSASKPKTDSKPKTASNPRTASSKRRRSQVQDYK